MNALDLNQRLTDVFGDPHPVALVTGSAAPRIGAAVVRILAARGYRTVVHANSSVDAGEKLVSELNADSPNETAGQHMLVNGDVSQEADVEQMFEALLAQHGRLDALVNCAAIWDEKALFDVQADEVRRHFEVNTLGSFLCAQRAGRQMVEQPNGGAIVNIGDWATERPYRGYAAYFPSKGAIGAMTRSLAVELSAIRPSVRVNCIMPGPAMMPSSLPKEKREAAIAATLVKREGSPEHIADAVVFLLENNFVTGVCLPVDGGRTIYSSDDQPAG